MDPELIAYLQGMEQRIVGTLEQRIVGALEQRIVGTLEQRLNDSMERRMAALQEHVDEKIRDAQAEILKAFFPFQESFGIRFRKLEADNSNLNTGLTERMGVLERRLQEIEKKLLMDPPAA